jgi:translation initiation factor 2B subunit (eIF-2B alpha/beta/delta family)/8-oxo-dGTP pyrophosphatase MutT (NUDIX family)
VVTIFLYHKGKICLVRRSQDASTYKGHWAGISGYLEGDPAEHFMVELQEETSLTPYEYTLIRRTEPYVIPDEQHGHLWHVHPFLCEVDDPTRISLDWENTELQWIEPDEMRHKQTVPALWEVYEMVSRLPLEREVDLFFQQLKEDMHSGARQIALKALEFLQSVCVNSNAASTKTLLSDLRYFCDRISSVRPSMAIIPTTLELVLTEIGQMSRLDVKDAGMRICRIIGRHRQEMGRSVDLAAGHLKYIIPEGATVLVHSYSSSVLTALDILQEKQCTLVVTESRPAMEGRMTAKIAAEKGMSVTLITDALAAHAMAEVDIVLLGADSIEQDGSIVNKAGSSLLAQAAHTAGVKVYVIGEMRKISLRNEPVELEEGGPQEVWHDAPNGILIRNVYFDRTLPRYLTGIMLENDIVEPYQIRMTAQSMQAHRRGLNASDS